MQDSNIKCLLTGAIAAAFVSTSALSEELLCIEKAATGFAFEGGDWKSVNFKANDKFLIQEIEKDKLLGVNPFTYTVKKFGEKTTFLYCKRPSSNLVCGGLGYGFVLNFENMRYQYYYGIGYLEESGESNTPLISIGECTTL